MSTNAKTGRKTAQKTRCRAAHPISNDRAEAFVGPRAEELPQAREKPSERDQRAFDLQAKGWTQRRIAAELRCSQPTVCRGIERYRLWFGTTLPEDRGEMTGWGRFRVAVEEHRIFLRHQQELAMEEWERSRADVPVKKTRTKVYPEGRKNGGKRVRETVTEKYMKAQSARVSHFNAATRLSRELTMLAGGYLGVRTLTCDQVIDPDERHRWDRVVKNREATIEELQRKVAELEGQLAAKAGRSTAPSHGEQGMEGCAARESRSVENSPRMNQNLPAAEVATPDQPAICVQPLDSAAAVLRAPEFVNQEAACGLGAGLLTPPSRLTEGLPGAGGGDVRSGVSAGPATRAEQRQSDKLAACPTQPLCRWSDEHRQEALDLHCVLLRLGPAKLSQASGIPDPKNMTPKQYVEQRRPYCITIDRSEEEARSWRLGQQRFDERQAEMLREP